MNRKVNSRSLTSGSYLALLILQPVWHALLPAPMGAANWTLALLATVPLLLPLKGLLAGSLRSMTWAGYLVMLYLVIGIMEAWSNPPQRIPALIQTLLVVVFVASVLVFSRADRPAS
ncbi:MAG: DUF2069 domain-containing protein [Gammaproteobacteria bacterium]|nr:DUF2069 domain-containing protein [Gammaproteobacteria bacterium]